MYSYFFQFPYRLLIDENLLSLMENYCQLVFPKSCSFKFNPLAKTCNPEIKLEIITEENTEEKNILREKPINVNVPNTGNTEEIFIEKLSQENISQLDEKSLKVPEKVKTKKKPKDFKTMEGFKGYVKDYVTGIHLYFIFANIQLEKIYFVIHSDIRRKPEEDRQTDEQNRNAESCF